jgi:hypothetical protein
MAGRERASQNGDTVIEQWPRRRRGVAGKSHRSKCSEALRREDVLLAKQLAAHGERVAQPRFGFNKVATTPCELSHVV